MRTAPAPTLSTLVCFVLASAAVANAAAPDRSVAGARSALEAARSRLAAAVKAIEKEPPADADLEAAHAAVGALKDAIDSGAEHEQNDLDYAKAALAARKELRTGREYVEGRRAKVHIFKHRRTIDAAASGLADRVKKLEGKDAAPKDFDDARAAAQAMKQAVDEGRQFAGQDQKYAAYLAEVGATLARQEKAIEDRWTAHLVARQRPLLDEARRALSAAVGALSKGSSDAQFEVGDKAAAELARRLEEGKALEPKDKAYRADADKARAELAQARKRMDEAFSATGVERLKAEIEPARKDLAATLRPLRGKPTADQLAEAKTAAIVVRKLLEKFQPQASRSQAFGQYIAEVKKTLLDVEYELQRRTLDAARAPVAQAMRLVEGRAPTDEHFAEANTALTVLEKTLESMKDAEGPMVKPVTDAGALLAASRSTLARRRQELVLDPARYAVAQALKPIDWKAVTDAHFQQADQALASLEKALEAVQKTPEAPALAKPLADARAQLEAGRAAVARRRVQVSVGSARAAAAASLKPLEKRAVTDEQFAAADAALAALEKTLSSVEGSKDPVVVEAAAEARVMLGDARATVARRRAEVSLDSARTAVGQSLRPLEKPAPTEEQFAEANTAVTVLEKTVAAVQSNKDAAAAVAEATAAAREARAALARRRVEVGLDPARYAVAQALKPVDWKAVTEAQFQEADQALVALEKAIEAAQKTPEAPAIAKPLADAKAQLETGRATVARRRAQTSLEAARAGVSRSLWPLEKRVVTDEQLAAADAALAALEKTLASVQASADPAVVKAAGEGKAHLAAAKATIAKRKVEVSLDRARTAVAAALRPLEKRAPADAQFAEADKAVTALEASIAAAPPKDEAVAPAVAEAKAALRDARATVAKRRAETSLDAARTAVTASLKPLEKPEPTDEQFAEANTALTVLEKTLASVTTKDAAAAVAEAKAALRDAKSAVARRRLEVDVQRQRARVEEERKNVAAAMSLIHEADAAKVQQAEAAVKKLQEVLEAGAALTKKDRVYAVYDVEVRKRIRETNGQIGRRKIALAAGEGRSVLTDSIAAAKAKLQAARQPEASDRDIEAAAKSVDAVNQAIETRVALEEQDRAYGAAAAKARDELYTLKEDLDYAKLARELRRKTVDVLAEAAAAAAAAASAGDVRVQKAQYEKALAKLRVCHDDGARLYEEKSALAEAILVLEGKTTTPKEVIALCTQRAEANRKLLEKAEALIRFDEGPKRAYEKGKALLKDGKKPEALEQFRECIGSGRILEHFNPDFKTRKFGVGGESLTLSELIEQCVKQRDALDRK